MQYIYLIEAICTTGRIEVPERRKLPAELLSDLAAKRQTHSLRQLAKEYGVSHETVRQTIATLE